MMTKQLHNNDRMMKEWWQDDDDDDDDDHDHDHDDYEDDDDEMSWWQFWLSLVLYGKFQSLPLIFSALVQF